ncbi:MAG: hypothetical protein LAP38_06890 [Acidobacteriia bacterium]|nr:hypothetical protein [Terriglobia bacterium]
MLRGAAPNWLVNAFSPETVLALVVLIAAPIAARLNLRWLGCWEIPLARLARKKRLAILAVAAAPLIARALLLPLYPVPAPRVHDEFSFLLAADTFAHGRLVNPQHPFWVHFESMHIFARPVYASAFPIAQAVALAAGKLLGSAWAGVWLSMGLMCGAICWMLQGWLPPRWALLGALLIVLRLGISSYWMNSYWGGCLAAAGGALVLGSLPRIMRWPDWRYAALIGVGLAILANSRPVEGAVFGIIVAVPLFAWMAGKRSGLLLRRVILPIALVLAFTGAGMGYYFSRVTGKPWLVPYIAYRNTISMAPHFVWQTPRPGPLYNNIEMRHFYVYSEMNDYLTARNSPIEGLSLKSWTYWHFYLGPLWTIPLFTLPLLWRDRKARSVLLMAAAFPLALLGQVWHNPHYASPATGLAILIVILGMRRLRLWQWRGHAAGLYLVRCLPLACALMLLVQIVAGRVPAERLTQPRWRWPPPGGVARQQILTELERSGGQHLVFVRYSVGHDTGDEWVYNGADIDGSSVVWARELDRGSNQNLMRYFAGRRAWLVEPDLPNPRPIPYREAPPRPMPFVQIGAPGIEVLRSAETVRRAVLERTDARLAKLVSCDAWNYYFSEATGVRGPDVDAHCYGADRSNPVPFEHWFAWLLDQR